MPEKPKSLADELMQMIGDYDWHRAVEGTPDGVDHVEEHLSIHRAIRSRLTAIESELNDLREYKFGGVEVSTIPELRTHLAYVKDDDQTLVPPRIESHSTLLNQWNEPGPYTIENCILEGPAQRPILMKDPSEIVVKDNTFEHPSGLPCSSELGNEDGG